MSIFLYIIISVLVVSALSLVGIIVLSLKSSRLQSILFILISLAAGSLLGDVFFHLLPELVEEVPDLLPYSVLIIGGILLFFSIEHILHWRHHCEDPSCEKHDAIHPVAHMNIIADGIHNFLDGVIIASAYLVSIPVGIATTIAVILHEIPQEIGDFGVLVHAGLSRVRALFFNFLSALFAIIGGVAMYLFGSSIQHIIPFAVAITIGGFIYIATSDLIPQLHKTHSKVRSFIQIIMLLVGVGIMYLLTFLE